MRASRLRAISWALATLVGGAAACGYIAEKGDEPRGSDNQPSSGVGVYVKQDFDCATDLTQPFMIASPKRTTFSEPWAIREGGGLWKIWYEERGEDGGGAGSISMSTFAIENAQEDCRALDLVVLSAEPVFRAPAGGWESEDEREGGAGVGAPAVLFDEGRYRMWYEGGPWTGIGYAESADGASWTRMDASRARSPAAVRPLLLPDQTWENGSVGSPAVLWHDGLYRMWYEGNVEEARSIGYADSPDGLNWTKRDALGRTSADRPGEVEPVLVATQTNWEFLMPEDPYGRVGKPYVLVHRSPLRTYYLMYYTANLSGRLTLDMDDMDSSTGIAYSIDGLRWEKAPSFSTPDVIAMEINPIMNEKLPISLGPLVEGSINSHSALSIVDEVAPMVVEATDELAFYMFWQQVDGVNQLRGLNGLGFAFTRNSTK